MTLLTIAQIVNGAMWFILVGWLAGSPYRCAISKPRPREPFWSVFWWCAVVFALYRVRHWLGLVEIPSNPQAIQVALGFNVLNALGAAAVMRLRWLYEGWRW